jgi:hypothetical protein
MRFLQSGLYPRDTLSLCFMELHSERLRVPSHNSLPAKQRRSPSGMDRSIATNGNVGQASREPSVYDVTADPQSHRRHPHSAISRGSCAWQGVVS